MSRQPTTFLPALLATALSAAGSGCGAAKDHATAVVSRDSAGITLVESGGPAWTPGSEWTVDPVPLLDLGSADGEEPFLFDYVENALRLADGAIVVANVGTGQLRFFDSAGGFLRQVGRRGGGPGEFASYSSLHLWRGPDGSILADDGGNRRVNVFNSTGGFLVTTLLGQPPAGAGAGAGAGRPGLLGVFTDGSWLVRSWVDPEPGKGGPVIRGRMRWDRHDSRGGFVGPLVEFDQAPMYVMETGRFAFTYYTIPFTVNPAATVRGNELLVLTGREPEIRRYAADGALRGISRWTVPRRRSADLFDRFKAHDRATITDSVYRERREDFLSRPLPLPELLPTHVRMIVDHAGNIWAQRYYTDWETDRPNDVIAPDGAWLGTVTLPPGSWLLEAGPDWVLVWKRDELDVEHVLIHRLARAR